MVDLSFRFEFVKFHLHRLVVNLQLFHKLSVALILLEELAVLSACSGQFFLETYNYLLEFALFPLLGLDLFAEGLALVGELFGLLLLFAGGLAFGVELSTCLHSNYNWQRQLIRYI